MNQAFPGKYLEMLWRVKREAVQCQTGGGDRNRTDGRGRQKGSGKQCIYISDQK